MDACNIFDVYVKITLKRELFYLHLNLYCMSGDTRDMGARQETGVEVNGELREAMAKAATYEELLACWMNVKVYIDTLPDAMKQTGMAKNLDLVIRCFMKPPYACDSGVKFIFEDNSAELEKSGVPKEFLLQTVRVGAIKSMLSDVERYPHQFVSVQFDGTASHFISKEVKDGRVDDPEEERQRLIELLNSALHTPNIDGMGWANREFAILDEQKKQTTAAEKKENAEQLLRDKEAAIERIQARMHEPGFHLQLSDAKLLRRDFEDKLIAWKAFFESSSGSKLNTFFQQNRNRQFTPDFFAEFVEACESVPEIKRDFFDESPYQHLPVEIINPESGWFAVLIINKQDTFGKFLSSAVSNMNSWLVL